MARNHPRGPRRHWDEEHKQQLLQKMGKWRDEVIQATIPLSINSDRDAAGKMIRAGIDDAAELLTGQRDYFWCKGFITPGPRLDEKKKEEK